MLVLFCTTCTVSMSLRIRVPFLWPEKRLCCSFRCGDVAVPVVGELVVLSWDRSSINLHSEILRAFTQQTQGFTGILVSDLFQAWPDSCSMLLRFALMHGLDYLFLSDSLVPLNQAHPGRSKVGGHSSSRPSERNWDIWDECKQVMAPCKACGKGCKGDIVELWKVMQP